MPQATTYIAELDRQGYVFQDGFYCDECAAEIQKIPMRKFERRKVHKMEGRECPCYRCDEALAQSMRP